MNRLKKLAVPSLLLAGVAMSPLVSAQGSFDGHDVNVSFELWELNEKNDIIKVLALINEQDVNASDSNSPDIEGFEALEGENQAWDIDFREQKVYMTFTSIEFQDMEHQYMYMQPLGFHFKDDADTLSDILYVDVNDQYAPSFYNKDLVRYDADNIHINLKGSMCHIDGMGSMPKCDNPDSPTGFNNTIVANILFADNVDDLYNWGEEMYPDLLDSHEESFYVLGYYVREYSNHYVGTKDGMLYLYEKNNGDLIDLGDIDQYMEQMHMDHMHDQDSSTDCPEGQHMMSDGICMDNMTM